MCVGVHVNFSHGAKEAQNICRCRGGVKMVCGSVWVTAGFSHIL